MITDALANRPTHIAHSAASRRQYVYVDDAVDALLLALDRRGLPRRAYNIAGDTSLTLAEVADVVHSVVPNVRVSFGNDPAGQQYTIGTVDLSVAKTELGYYPRTTLREGVARYAEWLKAQAI
jgi:nucleoside-diphosphate-sugar epimerase